MLLFYCGTSQKNLKEGEWYEEVHGREVVAEFLPGTNEKVYVISEAKSQVLVVFKAEIDLDTSEVNIIVNEDLSQITPDKLVKLR